MTAFSGLDDLIAKASSANVEVRPFIKTREIAGVQPAIIAGCPISLWTWSGFPSSGAVPGAVSVPDNTTAGSLKQSDAGGGREKFIVSASISNVLLAAPIYLYDRLLHIGGLSGTVTTAQAVGGAITRNTGGVGNLIAVEIYTQIGASSTTITAAYTNQSGASKTTSAVVFGNTSFREIGRMIFLPLAAGDTGVQGVTSVTVLATTGTAGNFGVTIVRPLMWVQADRGRGGAQPFGEGIGPVKIDAGACIAAWSTPLQAANGYPFGQIVMVES